MGVVNEKAQQVAFHHYEWGFPEASFFGFHKPRTCLWFSGRQSSGSCPAAVY